MNRLTRLASTSFGRRGSASAAKSFTWTSRATVSAELQYVGYRNGYHWAHGTDTAYPYSTNYWYRSADGITWTQFSSYIYPTANYGSWRCAGMEFDAVVNAYCCAMTVTPLDGNPTGLTVNGRVYLDATSGVVAAIVPSLSSGNMFSTATADTGTDYLFATTFQNNLQTSSTTGITRFNKASGNEYNCTIPADNRANTPFKSINAMAFGGGIVVAGGNYDFITYATDGIGQTFTNVIGTFTTGDIVGVAFGAGKFVAVTSDGRIATSTNGAAWTVTATLTSPAPANGITYAAGVFLVNTSNAWFHSSPDGVTWTRQSYPVYGSPGYYENHLGGNSSLAVAITSGGQILTSP